MARTNRLVVVDDWYHIAARAHGRMFMLEDPGFEALTGDEQDALVLGLMLGLPVELAARCVRGETEAGEQAQLWKAIEETFKYGKRSALRPLKVVLARHETLKKPEA